MAALAHQRLARLVGKAPEALPAIACEMVSTPGPAQATKAELGTESKADLVGPESLQYPTQRTRIEMY